MVKLDQKIRFFDEIREVFCSKKIKETNAEATEAKPAEEGEKTEKKEEETKPEDENKEENEEKEETVKQPRMVIN